MVPKEEAERRRRREVKSKKPGERKAREWGRRIREKKAKIGREKRWRKSGQRVCGRFPPGNAESPALGTRDVRVKTEKGFPCYRFIEERK